jgi:hypothetical protein
MFKFLDRVITRAAEGILSIGAKITEIWQYRFRFGITFDGPSAGFVTFPTGEKCLYISLLNVGSHGTRHWPFKLFEMKLVKGKFNIGHIVILGLIIGRSIKHDIDKETGETLGPDTGYIYWAFSCINHQEKNLSEVI